MSVETQSLSRLGEEQLGAARAASNGRAATTIFGGQQHDLRQTLIALVGGAALQEHDSPGDASLQVLSGRIRLTAGSESWEAGAGDYLHIPPQRHALEALSDTVVLLTVATRA